MQVVDTSIRIEIFCGTELGAKHESLLAHPEHIIVPTMVQYEIYKWMARERSADDANRAITFTNECHVEDMTTGGAILAAELSSTHKLRMSDTMIYASAQKHDVKLVTCDAHFRELPGVEYSEKPATLSTPSPPAASP